MKLYTAELRTFPHPNLALDEGILDLSDDLRVERLLEAYSFGIFPWPHEELPTLWYSPPQRGVLDFNELHVPKSLQKLCKRPPFTWSFNRAFEHVVKSCAYLPRPGQRGTWITKKLFDAYMDFHAAGYAHSLEVWQGTELVGGLYGVYVGGSFSGESMFYKVPNASKFALVQLTEFLRAHGLMWIDIQMVTPALESFGGKYISRGDFLQRLEWVKAQSKLIEFKT